MFDGQKIREEIERRLRETKSKLPTSSLGRLGKTAFAAVRGGRLALLQKLASKDTPLDTGALAGLVGSLGQLKGLAMKVGQLMSYLDVEIPPELRSALSALQTQSPAMPFTDVEQIVRRELEANAEPLLDHMTPIAVAAASIGQVHRAKLPSGLEVAVKVQYPGVEKAFTSDFRSASIAMPFVSLILPGGNVEGVVDEARRALLEECDYEREATYQERFAQLYKGHSTIVVPEVHRPYSSRHVLTTTWMNGMGFDAFLASNPKQPARDRLGEALFEFYLGTLERHGLYNWDPHPGNYIVLPDGPIAMLDYGSTREFSRTFVEKLVRLTRAVGDDDRAAMKQAINDLGLLRGDKSYDFEWLRGLVRSFYGPMLMDETRAIQLGEAIPLKQFFEGKTQLLKLHLPPEMLFILRIRFGVMSVLARLGARANWYRLERALIDVD